MMMMMDMQCYLIRFFMWWCDLGWCYVMRFGIMWCDMSGVSAVRLHGMTVASVKELQVAAQSLHLAQLRPLDISNQPGPEMFSLGPRLEKLSWNGPLVGINLEKEEGTIKMWLERQVHDRKCSYLRRGHRGRKLSKVIVIYVNCQWRECCSLRLRRVWQLFVEWGDDNAVCIEDKLDDCSGVMMYALHSMQCYGWWWPGPQWI